MYRGCEFGDRGYFWGWYCVRGWEGEEIVESRRTGSGLLLDFCFGIYCFCDLNLKEEGRRTRRDVDAREMSRTHFDKNTT